MKLSRYEAIDALRGIASLGIVIYHARSETWVGLRTLYVEGTNYSVLDRAIGLVSIPFSYMGSFIILFFVISGVCIHLPNVRSSERLHVGHYLKRRLGRVYPPYAAAIFLTMLLAILCGRDGYIQIPPISRYIESFLLVQNPPLGSGQVPLNGALWTIPIEVQAYLAYPLLLITYRKLYRYRYLFSSVFIMSMILGILFGSLEITKNTFLAYVFCWASGMVIAEQIIQPSDNAFISIKTSISGRIISATILIALAIETLRLGLLSTTLWTLAYGGLIIYSVRTWKFPRSGYLFRANKLVLYLGRISYSLYLVHYPILKIIRWLLLHYTEGIPSNFLVPILSALICVPFAEVFYRYIEKPSHLWAKR